MASLRLAVLLDNRLMKKANQNLHLCFQPENEIISIVQGAFLTPLLFSGARTVHFWQGRTRFGRIQVGAAVGG
jgi:hypothetical protein